MKKMNMTRQQLEDFIETQLEENDFEDVLSQFDLSPSEVFFLLYNYGHIDDSTLEELLEA